MVVHPKPGKQIRISHRSLTVLSVPIKHVAAVIINLSHRSVTVLSVPIEHVGAVVVVPSHRSVTVLSVPIEHVGAVVTCLSHWSVAGLYVPIEHVGSVTHCLVLGSRVVPSGHACLGSAYAVCIDQLKLPDAMGAINNITVIVKAVKIVLVIEVITLK